MKLESILILIGTGLTLYMFLKWRESQAATAASSATTTGSVKVTTGNGAYDGVSIGQDYLNNLYKLAYASGANGP